MKKSLTDKIGEVREITSGDMAGFKPISDVLPDEFFRGMNTLAEKRRRGRPRKEVAKSQLTVRLDAEVVDWLKKGGKGYQTRLNSLLREAMKDVE